MIWRSLTEVSLVCSCVSRTCRQPHLTLVMGWRVGVDIVAVVKGTRRRPKGVESAVQHHSAAWWWACKRGLCLQIRARRWDRGLQGVEGRARRGGWRPGNASCQTVHHVQHMSLSTYCSLCKAPFTIRMTEQFISCARMIDMSYLWKRCCLPQVYELFFFSSRQTAHMALFHTLSSTVIWHVGESKGRSFPCNYGRK